MQRGLKAAEALHGSARSQECVACTDHSLFDCGEAWENKFCYPFTRVNKPTAWSLSGFCYNYGRALVRARLLLVAQVPGPRTGLWTSWQ